MNINWIPDGGKYALALFIVKQLILDSLMKTLHDKTPKENNYLKK